jgi:hypothetical protein
MHSERVAGPKSFVVVAVLIACAGGVFGLPAQTEQATSERAVASVVFADKREIAGTPSVDNPTSPPTTRRKSMWTAAALSLAIPGAGEYYLGNKRKAKAFFAVEAAAWTGFVAFKIYSHWKKDDLINYAHEHAGADLTGRDDEYLDLVGFYTSTREYNTLGRVSDPDRPYLDESPINYWQWQSEDDRSVYRGLKNRSREANRRSQFLIGLAVINRIVSVIDAVRDARRQERSLDDSFTVSEPKRVQFSIDPTDTRHQLKLKILTGW